MSRRTPNAAADRATRNQQTLKNLLKLEENKKCADCKKDNRMTTEFSITWPRWASWNLGVFVCIRCSGIHRGMGTHISKVKSVDLDAWTDEQLQSVLRWENNDDANGYWEHKLRPEDGSKHVPADSKIENFIRTKYESKRWVMDGGMPDPATARSKRDDDVPLNVVQQKAKLERASSARMSSTSSQPPPPSRPPQNVDLFGDEPSPAPRPNTTEPAVTRQPPPKATAAPPKQSRPGDSLLGLDFLGSSPAQPAQPGRPVAVQPPGSTGPSRPDLKQSILSLYASAPKPQASSQPQHSHQASYSGVQSPPAQQPQQQTAFGGLSDDFGGLNFGSPASPPVSQQPKPTAFAGLGSFSSQKSTPAPTQVSSPPFGGGDFFSNSGPTQSKPAAHKQPEINPSFGSSDDFGAFGSAPTTNTPATTATKPTASSNLDDLFASSPPPPSKSQVEPPAPTQSSVFNLSGSQPPPVNKPAQPKASSKTPAQRVNVGWSPPESWGSNDVWASSDTGTSTKNARPPSVTKPPPPLSSNNFINNGSNDFGWGNNDNNTKVSTPAFDGFNSNPGGSGIGGGMGGFGGPSSPPKVSADEDFGGWSSAAEPTPAPPQQQSTSKPPATSKPASGGGGFGGSDDLFSNVWE
ncbi:MAG: hypothetical protein M1837_002391 [Sclerophora amabilis]|nr:MAG: hypothetical protein M1837_002391 [Sclerophora amabilis]